MGDGRATFDLLPAIDLRGGRVVRLVQGDFGSETEYGAAPAVVAREFVDAGARWLHVVDLDGARAGESRQLDDIRNIAAAVVGGARVEVAGGLRTVDAIDAAIKAGAARVVVGTAALRDPAFAAGLVASLGSERLAAAIDVRDGLALGEAWRAGAGGPRVEDAIRLLADAGVTTFEVTAIDRDGLLGGPDLRLLERCVGLGRGSIVASGGIGSVDDLRAVRALGCRGAIVGRALYEARFGVADAIRALDLDAER